MTAPKLRFKEFEEKIISSIFGKYIESSKYGPRFDAKDYSEQGNVRTIRGTDVSLDGAIKYLQVPLAKLPTKIVEEHQLLDGDILMITTADCGLSAVFYQQDIPYIASAYAVRIKLSNQNNSEWFKFYLQTKHIQNEVNKYVRKGTLSNLPLSDISKFLVNIPQIEEQTKIASFLSAVDEKISQLTQKHRLLCDYKQGMMQKLFSQKIRFKADDGSEFGEWEKLTIQDLVNREILDKPMDGNHGEIHPTSKDYVNEGIPFIMATDVLNGKINIQNSKKIRKEQADSLRKGFSMVGDVLLTHKATIGNVAIVPEFNAEYLMLTPQVTYYRVLNYLKLNNLFLKTYFESPQFQKNLLDLCTGATRLYIGISEQRKLSIILPCLEEQTKIANFLSAIDQKNEVVAQQIEQAKTWKKGLLQQMFV